MALIVVALALLSTAFPVGATPSTSPGEPPRGANTVPAVPAGDRGNLPAAEASLIHGARPTQGGPVACFGGSVSSRCAALEAPRAEPLPATGNGSGWTNVAYGHGPGSQSGGGGYSLLADDARDGYPFLLTPLNGSRYPGPAAYLRFANGVWSDLPVTSGPGFCFGSALAYDSTNGAVVYVPATGCPVSGTTWTYSAGVWTNRTTSVHPPARLVAQIADDPSDGYLVLFGGANRMPPLASNDYLNDTWTYANGTWTDRTASAGAAPSGRWGGAIAYDSTLGEIVLLGGHTLATSYLSTNDTWTYQGGSWSPVATSGPTLPSSRTFGPAVLVDDPADFGVLAVLTANGTPFNSSNSGWFPWLWVYSSTGWAVLNATGSPVSSTSWLATYASALAAVLFLTWPVLQPASLPTTFLYSAAVWTNETRLVPSPRFGASMTYDAADGYSVLFGGLLPGNYPFIDMSTNDTWAFHAGGWTRIVPNATPTLDSGVAGLVYDAADGYTLLFGATSRTGDANGTWEYTNGGWSEITPALSPPPYTDRSSLVYDGADGYVLLLSNWWVSVTTWAYHAGVWTNLSAQGVVSPGWPANPLVYDSTDGYVMLFGTIGSSLYYGVAPTSQTWIFQGGNWTNVTSRVVTPPAARSQASLVDDPSEGQVLLFGGSRFAIPYGIGSKNDTWAYANFAWTQEFTPVAPAARTDASVAYDASRQLIVLFGGAGTPDLPPPACPGSPYTYFCADTWVWSPSAFPSPVIQSFTANPATTDVGTPTTLTAIVKGGVLPYTYSFTGLPSGCASQNLSSLPCTPTAVGGFNVTVTVTDAAGNSTGGTTTLRVVDPPTIQAFFALPPTVPLGGRTLLSVQVSGGVGPLGYSYAGLPPGCTSQTVPTLPCSPSSVGVYTVTATAIDAAGAGVNASLVLNVTAVGSSPGPILTGFSFVPTPLVLGNSTTITVHASGGTGYLSYAYSGLPPGCAGANRSSLNCSPTAAGIFDVSMSVSDATGATASVSGNLTVFPVGGGGGATIFAFSAAPSSIDLGGSTVLIVLASGGVGPLAYSYPTLPPGCASTNVSSLPCTPSGAGNFTVYVVVSDSAGHRVGAVGRLTVANPSIGVAPSISLFLAAPSTVTVNETTSLFVSVVGGRAPLTYVYEGLPPGCTSASRVPLNCTPTHVGDFSITVTVTDAADRTTAATTALTVVPAVPVSHGEGGGAAFGFVVSSYGYLLVGIVAGALVAWGIGAPVVARRRARREGEEIVRAMNREIDARDRDERKEP